MHWVTQLVPMTSQHRAPPSHDVQPAAPLRHFHFQPPPNMSAVTPKLNDNDNNNTSNNNKVLNNGPIMRNFNLPDFTKPPPQLWAKPPIHAQRAQDVPHLPASTAKQHNGKQQKTKKQQKRHPQRKKTQRHTYKPNVNQHAPNGFPSPGLQGSTSAPTKPVKPPNSHSANSKKPRPPKGNLNPKAKEFIPRIPTNPNPSLQYNQPQSMPQGTYPQLMAPAVTYLISQPNPVQSPQPPPHFRNSNNYRTVPMQQSIQFHVPHVQHYQPQMYPQMVCNQYLAPIPPWVWAARGQFHRHHYVSQPFPAGNMHQYAMAPTHLPPHIMYPLMMTPY